MEPLSRKEAKAVPLSWMWKSPVDARLMRVSAVPPEVTLKGEAVDVAMVVMSTNDWLPAPFMAAVFSVKVKAVLAAVVKAQFQVWA